MKKFDIDGVISGEVWPCVSALDLGKVAFGLGQQEAQGGVAVQTSSASGSGRGGEEGRGTASNPAIEAGFQSMCERFGRGVIEDIVEHSFKRGNVVLFFGSCLLKVLGRRCFSRTRVAGRV